MIFKLIISGGIFKPTLKCGYDFNIMMFCKIRLPDKPAQKEIISETNNEDSKSQGIIANVFNQVVNMLGNEQKYEILWMQRGFRSIIICGPKVFEELNYENISATVPDVSFEDTHQWHQRYMGHVDKGRDMKKY